MLIWLLIGSSHLYADWPRITSAEDNEWRALDTRVDNNDNDEAAWQEIERLPLHVLMKEMVRYLGPLRSKPALFERYRAIILAKPDWRQWVQAEIDRFRRMKTIEYNEADYPGAERIHKLPENILHQEGYIGLSDLAGFLDLVGTVETVPFVAQYLSFPYIDAVGHNTAFRNEAASNLYYMQIPGAPNSLDPADWDDWWAANAQLYQDGPDGKVHGAAPTHFVMKNGKLGVSVGLPPLKPLRKPTSNPPAEASIVTPAPLSTTMPLPVTVTAGQRRWNFPMVIAGGIGLAAMITILIIKHRGKA